jgi:mannitol/fructose-specific phosphotransferase system IIA component (Ntr-type)
MTPSTRTPEGEPQRCPLCGKAIVIEPSQPSGDAPCPHCGGLVWFPLTLDLERLHDFHRMEFTGRTICTRQDALAMMLERLIDEGALPHVLRERVLGGLLKREEQGSTAIGDRIAVPHLALPGIRGTIRAAARFAGGVEFESIDRKPVSLVFLCLSPADQPREHLRFLEDVSRFLRSA